MALLALAAAALAVLKDVRTASGGGGAGGGIGGSMVKDVICRPELAWSRAFWATSHAMRGMVLPLTTFWRSRSSMVTWEIAWTTPRLTEAVTSVLSSSG